MREWRGLSRTSTRWRGSWEWQSRRHSSQRMLRPKQSLHRNVPGWLQMEQTRGRPPRPSKRRSSSKKSERQGSHSSILAYLACELVGRDTLRKNLRRPHGLGLLKPPPPVLRQRPVSPSECTLADLASQREGELMMVLASGQERVARSSLPSLSWRGRLKSACGWWS